eukprot:4940631-Pleurochrysis_carterae.AAC.1
MSMRPLRIHASTRSATSGFVRSWSSPPSAMSSVSTSTPRARSSEASVDRARPSPANRMSARGAGVHGASVAVLCPPPAAAPSGPAKRRSP